AALAQGATVADRVAIARVHLLPGLRGWDEPVLQIGTNGGPLARGIASYQRLDRLDVLVAAAGGRGNGTPCWTIANSNGDAAIAGYPALSPLGLGLGLLPEARFLSSLSVPPTAMYGVLGHVVGTPASIQLPAPFVVHAGDLIRLQTMYLEPLSPQVF